MPQVQPGSSAPLRVSSTPGLGRQVHAGEPLSAATLVALYRCLLIRVDRYNAWRANGTIDDGADLFWRNYTIELRFDDLPDRKWLCLPVGDAEGTAQWWQIGRLRKQSLGAALEALNMKVLVDWRLQYDPHIVSAPQLPSGRLQALAHLFNEPSGASAPNVNVRAHGAFHCGSKRSVCGIALASETVRNVEAGEELTWCYGADFLRHYEVSSACPLMAPSASAGGLSPPARHVHATNALLRGRHQGKVAREEFHENCAALGMAAADSSRTLLDSLFDQWDADGSDYLERAEVEEGIARLQREQT